MLASVHIEIPDTFTADKIDEITRQIQEKVYLEHNISIVSIGIYSVNTKDEKIAAVRNSIAKVVAGHKEILQMHGFFVDFNKKDIRFDLVVDFVPNMHEIFKNTIQEVQELYPEYRIAANLDVSYSD